MKIAVCDEDKMVRDDIVYLIKKQIPDVDIFTFVSGEELIDCGEDFDISVIDIEMEKMTGIDTAKKIRAKQERQGKIKSIIIFITKYSDYMESAFDVNAYHYLLKPIDNDKKVIIHTKDGIIASYGRMDELESLLGDEFYRCHRCYLVNMENISAYSADMVKVSNGDKLILAKKKHKDFVKKYMIYAENEG